MECHVGYRVWCHGVRGLIRGRVHGLTCGVGCRNGGRINGLTLYSFSLS